ncbi:PREDICTED: uncharacterized protein LOC104611473 isoform X4 [Nelumbo nucifera]|uniref:Uncharacterized protein LOC104611473 isoform X4 n=1 Tax=Nelumbo nucifera TaxID=4432 RepID=A0A1U8B748_NELNU|nr:PREDICTED: uncharacterized protein LOC104611473 isoform X4 [Nelumbo nucifera]XP_010276846.1 PREDICTED: uncharacterized protein LOC104611473 isoform X4 [Nelumbo nucifera]XP_019055650.1 PREDICTED: uncharacterized protein LOC104611473 isoform X4 [Nelumbo nucifera]
MQRSSLGSPGSKLHGHGGEKEEKVDGEERRKKEGCGVDRCGVADEDENKEEKLHRSMSYRSERSIHLIPILIIFCILVLYLCSYDPSQKELAHFNGFRWFSKPTDSTETGDFGRYLEIEKGDVLAIRSHRSLQEVGRDARRYWLHRKVADF